MKLTTQAVTNDLGDGVRSWAWTEPYQSSSGLFADGNWQAGAAYESYTEWLNTTTPRDFGGLDPFDQRACLVHQRDIFKSVGYDTHGRWECVTV